MRLSGNCLWKRTVRGPADLLHLVVCHEQLLRDHAVGGVLVRARRGPRAPESEQQHRLAQLRLALLGQLRKATNLLHHFS